VAAGALVAGPISGGVFNPAVALGLTVAGSTPIHEFPLFILAQLIGGAVAAFAYRYLSSAE
jgi:glycerol uptake facilitator-like aquaporin